MIVTDALAVSIAVVLLAALLHIEAHLVGKVTLLDVGEMALSGEIVKDGLGELVVVVIQEMTSLWHRQQSKLGFQPLNASSEIASDPSLAVGIVVVVRPTAVEEEVIDGQELTNPQVLSDGSILHVELTGHDEEGNLLVVNEFLIVRRVVNHVVRGEGRSNRLRHLLELRILGALVNVESLVDILLLARRGHHGKVVLLAHPVVVEDASVKSFDVTGHGPDVVHDIVAGVLGLDCVLDLHLLASLLEGYNLLES
mmetsp:Transcript_8502/g.13057  ORF Transcript_8502/g.13057 Transcript_8502/m.13057 type:complete len:254 (-) Transcript_8502:704-1465(-)